MTIPPRAADVGGVLLDDAAELVVERLEDLVEQQHLGRDRLDPGEPEARAHPQRVGVDRAVEGVVELHALGDEVHVAARLLEREPREHPEHLRVLAPGQKRRQPGRRREQRADAAAHPGLALVGGQYGGDDAQQRRLARAGGADQRQARSGLDLEVDAAQAPRRRADAAKQGQPRGHHTPEAVEVEAHADAVEPRLAAGQARVARFGRGAHAITREASRGATARACRGAR